MFKEFKIKRLLFGFVLILSSCSNDDGNMNTCSPELGELETLINNQTLFQARWTLFEYFENGALSVDGFVMDDNCLSRASVGFTAEPNLDRQNFSNTESFRESTNIRFRQLNEDVAIGSWKFIEGEPNWVEFDEITETIVKGRFQATLLIDENVNNANTLPDTLIFNNVSFEAVPGELLNGSN